MCAGKEPYTRIHMYSVCFYAFTITIVLRTRLPWDTDRTSNRPPGRKQRWRAYVRTRGSLPIGRETFYAVVCNPHVADSTRDSNQSVHTHISFYTVYVKNVSHAQSKSIDRYRFCFGLVPFAAHLPQQYYYNNDVCLDAYHVVHVQWYTTRAANVP